MGPRLQERGVVQNFTPRAGTGPGFNGAALTRARSYARKAPDRRTNDRFNGAALTRARSYSEKGGPTVNCLRFNGAALTRARSSIYAASMLRSTAMLQWGRAYKSAELQHSWQQLAVCGMGFNGAALTRARSSLASAKTQTISGKLQWGRAYKSAELQLSRRRCNRREELQWGRAYKSAEFRGLSAYPRLVSCASMGPRLQERGVLRLQQRKLRIKHRFNGAALTRARSSLFVRRRISVPRWLQWGRAYKSAELQSLNLYYV